MQLSIGIHEATKWQHKVVLCPECGCDMRRIHRSFLMRFVLGSQHFYCEDCGRRYLYFLFGTFLRVRRPFF